MPPERPKHDAGSRRRPGSPAKTFSRSGTQRRLPSPARFGILLISGKYERAHYAFVLATGAAALGREVVLFATNRGCYALLADWSGLEDAARDDVIRHRGVAGLDTLREAAAELPVRMIVCEAGLRAEGLEEERLLAGVEIAGIATFLNAVGEGNLISL